MDYRKTLLRLEEEIGRAHRALDALDTERFHGHMAVVASIAMSASQPRDPLAPRAEMAV